MLIYPERTMFFLRPRKHSFTLLNRSALAIGDTLLKLMAAAPPGSTLG